MRRGLIAVGALGVGLLLVAGFAAHSVPRPPDPADDGGGPVRLDPPLGPVDVRNGFSAPARNWLPGHRGVDLAGSEGQDVLAPGEGVVTFAGWIVDRGVVVIDHGQVRSSLEPVDPGVRVGQRVRAGESVGRLAAGHARCEGQACLHWGVYRSGGSTKEYLDPLSLLDDRQRAVLLE